MPTQMNLPVLVAAAVEAELSRNPERFRSTTPGPQGDSLTLNSVVMESDYSLTLKFSDGTVFNSLPVRGVRGPEGVIGPRGPRGVGVHHTRWTATTNPEHHFGVAGHMDTYTLYGDESEDIVLGWFSVKNGENGIDPYDLAVDGGYEGTRDEFYEAFIRNSVAIDQLQELIGQVEHLFRMVDEKGDGFISTVEGAINNFLEMKGAPGGFAELDETGKVPIEQVPEAAKGVIRVNTRVELPITGVERQLYLVVQDETAEGVSTIYHWNGYTYLPVTSKLDADVHQALLDLINTKADGSLSELLDEVITNSATKEELNTVNSTLTSAVEELSGRVEADKEAADNAFEDIFERLERKAVEEFACFCNLPETGEPDKIYVVIKDECRANTLSFYYWDGDQYRLACGTAVKELEKLGDTAEAAISHVWNTGTSTILSGTPIMVSGGLVDSLLGVTPLLLTDPEAVSKYVGIALTDIPGNTQGVAVRSGMITGFNTTATQGEDWIVGDALYFRGNGSGVLSKVKPADARYYQPVAYALHVSVASGIIYLASNPFGQFSRTGAGLVGDGTDESPLDVSVVPGDDNLLEKTNEGLEVLVHVAGGLLGKGTEETPLDVKVQSNTANILKKGQQGLQAVVYKEGSLGGDGTAEAPLDVVIEGNNANLLEKGAAGLKAILVTDTSMAGAGTGADPLTVTLSPDSGNLLEKRGNGIYFAIGASMLEVPAGGTPGQFLKMGTGGELIWSD